ncbi:MAG: hypothetical protein IC227_00965 [Enterococcus lacertideformus]|uniref:Bacterial Ig domain-containing protein n=1 Tax=Enterococcus lacertideformus TaxID=2771493 RepID=A0A931AUC9_9ENTE|nr:hypothetical protein [Enterococcus lacertideformus]
MDAAISKAEQLWAQESQNQIVQEATEKVNCLFNGENLADGVNQDKINEAQAAVDKVTDEAKKQELQDKINKAQELLNKQNEQAQIVQEATEKVNGLFNGENLADGVNQDKINEAQAAVDKVADEAKKQELQDKINKAQELLDKKNEQFTITSVDPYKEGVSQFVTGTYTGKNAGYIRLIVNGEKTSLVSMKGLPEGTFKYYMSGLKATDKVSVVIYGDDYKQLAEKEVTIEKGKEPVKIITSVDPYKEGESQFVTGTYTGDDAAYIRLIVNGEKTALVSMKGLPEGTFKYYMSGLKATDKVSVVIYGNDYKQLAEKEVTIEKGKEPVKITSVDPYKEGESQFVTGIYTGDDAAYIRLIDNGEKTALVSMKGLPEGIFKYYMSGLKATDKVSVVMYSSDYKQVAEQKVTIDK